MPDSQPENAFARSIETVVLLFLCLLLTSCASVPTDGPSTAVLVIETAVEAILWSVP